MAFTFIALGDLHLEALDNLFPTKDHVQMQLDAATKVVDYARSKKIKTVVQLGDIFENPKPRQHTILQFIKWLALHSDINFHIILGNHDWESSDNHSFELLDFISKAKVLKHVKIYSKREIVDFDYCKCCFVPYPYHQPLRSDTPMLCFGHFEVKGAIRDNGMVITKGEVLSKKHQWIIGHLHRQQPPVYPGTIYQLNFGEPLPKGFFVVSAIEDEGKLEVDRKWIEIEPPYKLVNKIIKKGNRLKGFDEPNTYYKLFIKASVSIPDDFLLRYPQVLKVEHYKHKPIKHTIDSKEEFSQAYNPTDGLVEYLKSKGLTKKMANKAKDMVNSVLVKSK